MEVAGEVISLGSGVVGFKLGDRVGAYVEWGGYAEKVSVKCGAAMRLPEGMSIEVGAFFPTTYTTSYIASACRARLEPGETVLITGAGGGVGLSAIEVCKALKANVIAVASSAEKCNAARAMGADHVLNCRPQELPAQVRELTGGAGVDVVLDPVGGDAFDAAMRCVAFEGRIVVLGFAGGRIAEAGTGRILIKSCAVMGSSLTFSLAHRPERIAEAFAVLSDWYKAGLVSPAPGRVMRFAEAPLALALVEERKATGKIVLVEE
jgi:NADPH2:quinone reductase